MQSPNINSHLTTSDPIYLNWSQKTRYYLGRIFSFGTLPLARLITQVIKITYNFFSQAPKQIKKQTFENPEKIKLPLKKFKKEIETKLNNAQELEIYFESIASNDTPCLKEEKKEEAASKSLTSTKPFVNSPSKEESTIDEANPQHPAADKITPPKAIPIKKEDQKPLPAFKTNRFMARRLRGNTSNLMQEPAETKNLQKNLKTIHSKPDQDKPNLIKTPTTKPIIIDCGGSGNCQLLSILKGIERQYSSLLKYNENGKSTRLTAQKLRELGVQFVRDQINQNQEHADIISTYVDIDRKEHNQCILERIQSKYQKDQELLKKNLENNKISLEAYKQQKDAYETKLTKSKKFFHDRNEIKTSEDFLRHLEKSGFSCSTVHLFALSAVLKLPIYVIDQRNHREDPMQFNLTKSEKDPIYLYRVNGGHYQYLFYPKSKSLC